MARLRGRSRSRGFQRVTGSLPAFDHSTDAKLLFRLTSPVPQQDAMTGSADDARWLSVRIPSNCEGDF